MKNAHITHDIIKAAAMPLFSFSGQSGGAQMHKIEQFFAEHMVLVGAVLAFATSMLRLAFVKKSFLSKLIESAICASVTVGVFYGLAAIYPIAENVALAIGSAVGYLGTDKIKELIMQKIEGKDAGIGKSNRND